jgi:cephalosporin-C deacetylase-like acetyl esterase
MNPFDYDPRKTDVSLKLIETKRHWSRYSVSFPAALPSSYSEQNTVQGEYYRLPGDGKHPLAILVHGLGDSSTIPCSMLARDLAKKGIASFVIYLVFHSRRMPAAIKKKMPFLSPEEWFDGYRTSIIDIRQVLDWAGKMPEIDIDKTSIAGISLGGIISAISMGIDRRIKAGAFIVAGGNYESPTWLKRGRKGLSNEECARAVEAYRAYLDEVRQKGFENVEPLKKSYLTDPVTFAGLLRGRPMLMLNASWDEMIPRQSSIDLWESLARPPVSWYPATHALIWAYYPSIRSHILDFLQR